MVKERRDVLLMNLVHLVLGVGLVVEVFNLQKMKKNNFGIIWNNFY
jgi:hypothetical protein